MSRTSFMQSILNPVIVNDFHRYKFQTRGYSAEIFTNPEGIALKLYDQRYGIDTTFFEHSVLSHLRSTRLACPQLIDCVQIADRWGFRYRWIEGETFKDAFGNRFWRLEKLARAFAQLHAMVHEIDGFDALPSQDDYYRSILLDQPHLRGGEDIRLLDLLAAMPNEDKLCHGDFNPRNTLMDSNRGHAIDWQSAYRGNPLGDVAKTWVKLSYFAYHCQETNRIQKLWLTRFCRSYIRHYLELTELDTSNFLQWIAVVAGAQCRSDEPPKRFWYRSLIDLYHTRPEKLQSMVFPGRYPEARSNISERIVCNPKFD
jgi:tRNA A-37 threonylcarbamoyl transferase component Bud32